MAGLGTLLYHLGMNIIYKAGSGNIYYGIEAIMFFVVKLLTL